MKIGTKNIIINKNINNVRNSLTHLMNNTYMVDLYKDSKINGNKFEFYIKCLWLHVSP